MVTYYVRKTGNDSNAGTSAGAAWATIGKALTSGGVAAGDTVYIGAGTYREVVTASLTNPASEVRFVGDIDGAKTGDAGEVVWSPFTSGDTSSPSTASTLNGGSKNNLTFERITFIGTSNSAGHITALGSNVTFRECAFLALTALINTIVLTMTGACNLLVERCVAFAPQGAALVAATHTQSASAEYDSGIIIRNCTVLGFSSVLSLATTGSNTYKGGGGRVEQCTINGGNILATAGSGVSAQYPAKAVNCLMVGGGTLISEVGLGQTVAEHCRGIGHAALGDVSQGLFHTSSGSREPHLDFGQGWLYGLTPRPFLSPLAGLALGPNAPLNVAVQRDGAGTDDATVGTITWTDPDNAALANDGASAVASTIPATTGVSHYLMMLGGVAVPSGATIRGVRVEAIVSASAFSSVSASSVKLVKGGVISGNDGASFNTTQFTTSLTRLVWRSTGDPLWGLTLTDSDVNAADFGCAFAVKNTSGAGTRNCTVESLRVIVTYELAGDSYDQTVDLLNRPRPAGMGQLTGQVGALELHDTGSRETSVTHGGAASLKLIGPGDQQFDIPVDAVSTTISVWTRFDTNHGTTTRPQLVLLEQPELGVSAATDTAAGAVDTWEQLSLNFTPAAKGVVTVRLVSRPAAASGIAYFDDLEVS